MGMKPRDNKKGPAYGELTRQIRAMDAIGPDGAITVSRDGHTIDRIRVAAHRAGRALGRTYRTLGLPSGDVMIWRES